MSFVLQYTEVEKKATTNKEYLCHIYVCIHQYKRSMWGMLSFALWVIGQIDLTLNTHRTVERLLQS